MPYFKDPNDPELIDSKGNRIQHGDLLQSTDPTSPWQYFICFLCDCSHLFEIRDLNANNVGMCDTGLNGDVINIGHYSKHPEIFPKEDIDDYFPNHERDMLKAELDALKAICRELLKYERFFGDDCCTHKELLSMEAIASKLREAVK